MKKHSRKKIPLYLQILIGMVAGILIGILSLKTSGEAIVRGYVVPWGQLFIRLLQLIAIPLVFFSLVKGVMGLKNIASFSRMGGKTILIYIATTLCAVVLGLAAGWVVKPGGRVNKENVARLQQEYLMAVEESKIAAGEAKERGPLAFLDDIVPSNIVGAAGDNTKMLQVIFFALFFGVASLSVDREKVKPVIRFFNGITDITLRMVDFIVRFAPWGVTALMAGMVVDFNGDPTIFSALGIYALTVVGSLLFMILVFYPLLVKLFTRTGVRRFLKSIYPVQLFAFTTSSSAATLPVTIETVEQELGVSPETASFVLPVGATINMDGTSCYQSIAILFIAQVLGIDLTLQQLFVIVGMTVLSSIGTPAIPGGSYVILTMVLTSVGIPAEGLALILGIDRPLDMLRTAVNVTGDATVSLIVDKGVERDPELAG